MNIPAIMIKGKVYESLDNVCYRTLKELQKKMNESEEGIVKAEMHKSMHDDNPHLVDWNQYNLDELANYLSNKYMFSSSGEALAIHKLIEFYEKNK
jgi:hypothetical protein